MDIYLTYLETGDWIRFPMLPEHLQLSMGNVFGTYDVLGVGEWSLVSGQKLDRVSWSGLFPGECRQNQPYIRSWTAPLELYKWLEHVKAEVGISKKLRLLITETSVNMDVYLESFSGEYQGGQGDLAYDISFIQAKDMIVTATSSASSTVDLEGEGLVASTQQSSSISRTELVTSNTYTVVAGDCLWAIAQRFYGNGSRYGEIYAANQGVIDSKNAGTGNSKYTIYPAQVFTIP